MPRWAKVEILDRTFTMLILQFLDNGEQTEVVCMDEGGGLHTFPIHRVKGIVADWEVGEFARD